MRKEIKGKLLTILGYIVIMYYAIFVVETSSELAFLLLGLACGLVIVCGFTLMEKEGGKE